jgi:hypothetical protein
MKFRSNIFKRAKSAWAYRSEPEEMRFIANFYWHTLLAIALCAAVFAFLFSAQELGGVVQAINTPPSIPKQQVPTLTQDQIQSILDVFSARQAGYLTLSNTPAEVVADPSVAK